MAFITCLYPEGICLASGRNIVELCTQPSFSVMKRFQTNPVRRAGRKYLNGECGFHLRNRGVDMAMITGGFSSKDSS